VNARQAKVADGLLPGGRDVRFGEIEVTLARIVRDGRRRRRGPARALTATVIVVGKPERLIAAAEALEQLGEAGGVRAILISEGEHTSPTARVTENAIAISGLAPRYLNNAVAALRLSSLPALVWWRGGSVESLDGLANLADRLVLDTVDPEAVWARADTVFERTALTDLRWAALTRWRAALAHLFDLPHVRRGAGTARTLTIEATDVFAARLFAGWLKSQLRWTSAVTIEIRPVKNTAVDNGDDGPKPLTLLNPLRSIQLAAAAFTISLSVPAGRACLEASVANTSPEARAEPAARVVPLGDGTLSSLIGEELGVRTRDLAFEQALITAREISI
jgi:glucose-6-phosphate dehydrogenase assembly protein OpcA